MEKAVENQAEKLAPADMNVTAKDICDALDKRSAELKEKVAELRKEYTEKKKAKIPEEHIHHVALNRATDGEYDRLRKQAKALEKKLDAGRKLVLSFASRRVLSEAGEVLNLRRMDVDLLREKLFSSQQRILDQKKHRFSALTASLDALSPLKVLSRGYAAALDENRHIIRSVSELSPGAKIDLRFADGRADCTVNALSTEHFFSSICKE